jgi:hypothetical protein
MTDSSIPEETSTLLFRCGRVTRIRSNIQSRYPLGGATVYPHPQYALPREVRSQKLDRDNESFGLLRLQ